MKKLHVFIAESALELVPRELVRHPAVRSDAKRREVEADTILLDRSIHHSAMLKLKDGFKRGRPDLVHLALLNVTSTPIHQEGKAKVYVHTNQNTILVFAEGARPPKSYFRFRNLMEKVLVEYPESGVIRLVKKSLPEALREIKSDHVIGFSIQGPPTNFESTAETLRQKQDPSIVIGGFPKGHFLPENIKAFDKMVRIHERPLDAHIVIARAVYEVEKAEKGGI